MFDLVVRNGVVVTASDTFECDIGVENGTISAMARRLPPGEREHDARGNFVLPGGIDGHVHLDQDSPETGAVSANNFYSGTVSAACGGTTTVIPFARQVKGSSLRQAVTDYHARAENKAVIDYAFHVIVTDPTPSVLGQELPALAAEGYTSVKFYMTYDALKLADMEILEILEFCRREGAMPMVHAENSDCIKWLSAKMLNRGLVHPRYKGVVHNPIVEREAATRAISFAELADVPLLIVHVATAEAAEQIRSARSRGLKIIGETCPQYLVLTEHDIDKEGMEGAKCICSPPPQSDENRRKLWQHLETGTFQVFSSDHAPFRMDSPTGKFVQGTSIPFSKITNGLPGIELRMPLLFSEGVQTGRISINEFVALTSTNAAKTYGLYPKKGTICIGADADLAIWNPNHEVRASIDILHDEMDYTPYEGIQIKGWPTTVFSRGKVVCQDLEFRGNRGHGEFLRCNRPNVPRQDDYAVTLANRFLAHQS
jgi:dihydropyrimidinase